MNCALETRSVCSRGSDLPSVESISLCAHWGELLVVLGEDASATTLVRLMAGVVTPTAGKVFVDGHDTDHPNPWPRLDPRHFATGPEMSAQALVSRTAASILLLEEPTESVDAYEFHKTLMRCRQRADDGDLVVLATRNAHLARVPGATIACVGNGRLTSWGDRSVVLPRR